LHHCPILVPCSKSNFDFHFQIDFQFPVHTSRSQQSRGPVELDPEVDLESGTRTGNQDWAMEEWRNGEGESASSRPMDVIV
jgi:hypothetical protein